MPAPSISALYGTRAGAIACTRDRSCHTDLCDCRCWAAVATQLVARDKGFGPLLLTVDIPGATPSSKAEEVLLALAQIAQSWSQSSAADPASVEDLISALGGVDPMFVARDIYGHSQPQDAMEAVEQILSCTYNALIQMDDCAVSLLKCHMLSLNCLFVFLHPVLTSMLMTWLCLQAAFRLHQLTALELQGYDRQGIPSKMPEDAESCSVLRLGITASTFSLGQALRDRLFMQDDADVSKARRLKRLPCKLLFALERSHVSLASHLPDP